MAIRLAAPAPVATIIGSTPRMNVNAVISTARKRSLVPTVAALMIDEPRSRSSLENFHNQNGVLSGQTDEQNQTQLGVNAQRKSGNEQTGQRAEHGDGDRGQNRQRC